MKMRVFISYYCTDGSFFLLGMMFPHICGTFERLKIQLQNVAVLKNLDFQFI